MDKCSGIRCYAKTVGEQYLSEGVKTVSVKSETMLGNAVVRSVTQCVMNLPKTYVAGTLLSNVWCSTDTCCSLLCKCC